MWHFLSRGFGETEGFSTGSLVEFKGNPLSSLAREVCQNSLDAADDSGKPVIIEFEKSYIPISDFPGMDSLKEVIDSCDRFWSGKGDSNTKFFLENAKRVFAGNKFYVLRVSDYNTTGVKGAFSDEDITPWGGLVKGNAFSVKNDDKNAAGSYGIGKAAPFVSSYFQTVFYRTLDNEGIKATMGVARLMAHNSVTVVPNNEDPVRRSVGYYGETDVGKPSVSIPELDQLNERTECGTDLFIPGFTGSTTDDAWVKEILTTIIDNFLYSIYNGKLEIRIGRRIVNKFSLRDFCDFIDSKDAKVFYEVIRDNPKVEEITLPFHDLGTLRLRLLYEAEELNKKVLVVRKSGMKIARIPSLPRLIAYTGFLELQGSDLNEFFRAMENQSHNAWEYKRHKNPSLAKKYKEEVESWVTEQITKKLIEKSGSESEIDIGDCFSFSNDQDDTINKKGKETVTDDTLAIKTEVYTPQLPSSGKISIRDEGNTGRNITQPATEDPFGEQIGHRHRSGKKPGGHPTGRKVTPNPDGIDSVDVGNGGKSREVLVQARIIAHSSGISKLLLTPDEDIKKGRIFIVAKGENGSTMKLLVRTVMSDFAKAEEGCIVIEGLPAKTKATIDFELEDKHIFAMGVKAYEY